MQLEAEKEVKGEIIAIAKIEGESIRKQIEYMEEDLTQGMEAMIRDVPDNHYIKLHLPDRQNQIKDHLFINVQKKELLLDKLN